jgi:hypothetical protein
MSMTDIHVGDVGTVFELTLQEDGVAVNISTATLKQFIYTKPSGTATTKTASFTTDGSNGKLRYVSLANDLDTAGVWQLQAYVELPTGKWHSTVIQFVVEPNLA